MPSDYAKNRLRVLFARGYETLLLDHSVFHLFHAMLCFPPDVTQFAASKRNFVMKLPYLTKFSIGN